MCIENVVFGAMVSKYLVSVEVDTAYIRYSYTAGGGHAKGVARIAAPACGCKQRSR